MEQREKIEAAVRDLRGRGVGAFTAAPPIFRWLWRLGVGVPPPLFIPFGKSAIALGVAFAVLWPAVGWLLRGGQFLDSLPVEAATALLGGTLFGISMAGYYRYRARRLRLPAWEQYPESSQLP